MFHRQKQEIGEVVFGVESEIVEKQEFVFHHGHIEVAVAHIDPYGRLFTRRQAFQEDRAGMTDDGFWPFRLDSGLQGVGIGKHVDGFVLRQAVNDYGPVFGQVEAEIQVLVVVVRAVQGFGDEGGSTFVDNAADGMESAVVQPFGIERFFQGVEKVVAVGEQVRLVVFQSDEPVVSVEKGKRKTTQGELDGQSVLV